MKFVDTELGREAVPLDRPKFMRPLDGVVTETNTESLRAERRVLDVLASRRPMLCTRSQLAVLCGLSAKGGTFLTYLSRLKTGGWTEESPTGLLGLSEKAEGLYGAPPAPKTPAEEGGIGQTMKDWLFGTKRRQGVLEAATKSTVRTMGNQFGRQILRGILGGMTGKRR